MEFIKLDGRHTLYRRGFSYAFVFRDHGKDINEHSVAYRVREAEGMGWLADNTSYGKSPKYGGRRPYYIGFRKEETATAILLQMK